MIIVGQEKPPLEALTHHGVKGMKWGVRQARNDSIRSARAKVGSNVRTINSQIDKTNLASGKAQEREAKKLAELQLAFLKNPDRATALRLTTGEKAAATILALGVPVAGPVGVAVGLGARVAVRKSIEKSQQN